MRTIDQDEDLAYAKGSLESKRLFEQGFKSQNTKRTIDQDEDLAFAKAAESKRLFEEGTFYKISRTHFAIYVRQIVPMQIPHEEYYTIMIHEHHTSIPPWNIFRSITDIKQKENN